MQNLHCRFDRYYIGKIYGGDFAKVLCPSQNIWILRAIIFFKYWQTIIFGQYYWEMNIIYNRIWQRKYTNFLAIAYSTLVTLSAIESKLSSRKKREEVKKFIMVLQVNNLQKVIFVYHFIEKFDKLCTGVLSSRISVQVVL